MKVESMIKKINSWSRKVHIANTAIPVFTLLDKFEAYVRNQSTDHVARLTSSVLI